MKKLCNIDNYTKVELEICYLDTIPKRRSCIVPIAFNVDNIVMICNKVIALVKRELLGEYPYNEKHLMIFIRSISVIEKTIFC